MNARIHPANARGHADHGWLDSHHTFSFAGFRDPSRMGFRHLRVINDDKVQANRGFGTHPHQNMEIISVPLAGQLAHRDTLGNGSTILPGEVQLMSAGRGISHSEMNPSRTDTVHFLQIWILPNVSNQAPGYQQVDFGLEDGVQLVVSPDGQDGSLVIKQDVALWRVRQPAGGVAELPLTRPHTFVQVTHGQVEVAGALLNAGDGMELTADGPLTITFHEGGQALVFDLI